MFVKKLQYFLSHCKAPYAAVLSNHNNNNFSNYNNMNRLPVNILIYDMLITFFLNTKVIVFCATERPEPKRQINLQ